MLRHTEVIRSGKHHHHGAAHALGLLLAARAKSSSDLIDFLSRHSMRLHLDASEVTLLGQTLLYTFSVRSLFAERMAGGQAAWVE